MQSIDKKIILKHALVISVAFIFTYFIDQYYFQAKQLFFLAKPIGVINSALEVLSCK